jgi:hypothetical protein
MEKIHQKEKITERKKTREKGSKKQIQGLILEGHPFHHNKRREKR